MTGIKARRLGGNTWQKKGSDRVLQSSGTKPVWYYINRRQVTVSERVSLRSIFEVCAKKMGNEGGGQLREQWWRQTDVEREMKTTIKEILAA